MTETVKAVSTSPTPAVLEISSFQGGMYASIEKIMLEMQVLNQKMRDMLQEYKSTQVANEWEINISSLKKKFKSIDKAFESAQISGYTSAAAGGATAATGTYGAKTPNAATGSAVQQMGSGGGRSAEGIAKVISSEDDKDSQKLSGESDLIAKNAQAYQQDVRDLTANIDKTRSQLQQFTKDFVDLMNALNNSVRM